jgi:hypothetical protein
MKQRGEAFEGLDALARMEAFRTRCRSVHDLGLWAAATLGVAQAETYAGDLVATDIARPTGVDSVFDRLRQDFAESGLPHSDLWLRRRIQGVD